MWFTFEKKILNWSCVLLRFWTNLKRNVSQTCPVSVFITNDGSVRSCLTVYYQEFGIIKQK